MAGRFANQSFQHLPGVGRERAGGMVGGASSLVSASCPEFHAHRPAQPPRAAFQEGVAGVVNMASNGMAHSFAAFARMRATNTLVDVWFEVGGRTVAAHRCVVASHSHVLGLMLSNPGFLESSRPTIALHDTDAAAFASLVDCMYGLPVVVRKDQVVALLAEADKWEVGFVKDECAKALRGALEAATCWHILAVADQLSLPGLKADAQRFVCVNFGDAAASAGFLEAHVELVAEVLDSDLLWLHHELTVFKACCAWLGHSPDRHALALHVLSHVRFTRMQQGDVQVLRHVVAQSPDPVKSALHHLLVASAGQPHAAALSRGPVPLHVRVVPRHRRCTGAACQVVLRGHNDSVTAVVFANNLLVSASSDTTIKVWDTTTWALKCTLIGHTGWVTALCVVGDQLVSASDDQTLRVWDMRSWECVRVVRCNAEWTNAMVEVNGRLLCGGAELAMWDCTTWELVGVLSKEDEVQAMEVVGGFLFSASAENAIKVWDVSTWRCVHVMRGHTDAVLALAAVDGKLFSGSEDMTIRMWDCQTFACEHTVKETEVVTALAVVDGKLVSGTNDDLLKVWDTHSWHCEYAIPGCAERVNTAFTNGLAIHNGKVAVAAADGNIRLLVPE